MNGIFPDYPGVESLCINCGFCTASDIGNTAELGYLEGGKWVVEEVLVPGTFICINSKSEKYEDCIVGFIGCIKASQLQGMDGYSKKQILLVAESIAKSGG